MQLPERLYVLVNRVATLLLFTVLTATLVAGCGESDKKEAAQQKTEPPKKEQAAPKAEQAAQKTPPPAPKISVVKVEAMDIPMIVEYPASVEAKDSVAIRARVQGYLQERHFDEGSAVKEGDLLFTIDPSEYEQSLKEAKAKLDSDEATLTHARNDLARFKSLVDQGAVSKDDYETRLTTVKENEAAVDSDKANVKQAELNLGYTTIKAPISGRISRAQAQPGDLVGKGENTLLATITSVDPINVNFSISEQDYLHYIKMSESNQKQTGDGKIMLLLPDGTLYSQKGKIDMVDPSLDSSTGTLGLRANFPNPQGLLRPGQFGRIRIAASLSQKVYIIPQRAIQEIQGMPTCLVVSAKNAGTSNTVESKMVTKGQEIGSLITIIKGLEDGDLVLTEGMQKIRAGMAVDPQVAPLDLTPLNQMLGETPQKKDAATPAESNATQTSGSGQ